MSKRVTVATVMAVALALSACGGGSGSAGTTDPPPATDGTTTVDTGPEPTEPPAITEAPTTSSSTTQPAPTTTEPSIEHQVRAAALGYIDFYVECLRAPDDCDPAEVTLEGSDARGALTRTVEDLVAGGLYVGDEDPGYQLIESIEQKDDHTLVTICGYTTMVLYLLPPIDGAEPTIQNNTPGTVREAWQFVQDPEDAVWKLRRGDTLSTVSDANECPQEEA